LSADDVAEQWLITWSVNAHSNNSTNVTAAQMPPGLTIWRIVAGLMGFWLIVLLLMSSSLYQSADNTDESLERQLFDAMQNLAALRLENRALKKEAEELR